MDFLNRTDELRLLEQHLDRPGAGLFVLYGRRRVGKTAMLEKLLTSRPRAAYHVATRSTVVEEMSRLSSTLAEAWDVPFLRAQPLRSSAAFVAFLEGIEQPRTLVLDEFPFLVESDASLPGLLQAAWDRRLSRSEMKLICCGSSVSVMQDTFLESRSPLFGRRTGQLKLEPLAPHHLASAFPWNPPEILELAALFGGIPGYLRRLEPGVDLLENLRRHVMARGEPLYEELAFLLREELREPRVYQAILATIALGARKFSEISSKVGIDRANLSRYLGVLADLGLVEREVPVTERNPEKSRKGLYRLADPFVSTWFTFVHPNRDALERGRADRVIERIVRPALPAHLGKAIEPVIRELFLSGPLSDDVPFVPAHAGRYWSDSAEFDVVLLDEAFEKALVAEVKWSTNPVRTSLLAELRDRVRRVRPFSDMECTCVVVSRGGFTGAAPPDDRSACIDISKLRWDASSAGNS